MPEDSSLRFGRGRHAPLSGWRDRPGDRQGDRGIRRHRAGVAAGQDRIHHVRRRLRQHLGDQERHHLHRRRRGHPALPRLPDRAAGREVDVHRGQLPADLRRAADRRRAGEVHQPDPAAHPAARGPQAVLRRLPPQRAPDAGAVQRGQRAVRVLPGLARPARQGAGRAVDHPAAGQAADHRGLRLQEVGRAAVPVPGQLADAGRELPADDVRLPRRALRGRPRDRAGAGPAADPARRPRAELLDVDGAAGRLVAGQPVHLDLRRHQRAVGPAARRRQPGRAGDARRRSGQRRRRQRRSSRRSRTAKTA